MSPSSSGDLPSSTPLTSALGRRALLRGVAGLAGAALLPVGLTACGSTSKGTSSPGSGSGGGAITFGSNYSDTSTRTAFAALTRAATGATGTGITINTVDHNTFQQTINTYLQGTPNDLFTWFAGYRMQFFADQGLIGQIDDVWDSIGAGFNDAAKALSRGLDGHYYFVPMYNYPWVVWYSRSLFASKGYTVPATWDEFVALAQRMKTDGLVPLAFADKDGWPALGTFDIINLRVNGYDYHIKLMKHEIPWTDKGVTSVFDQWAQLLPYCQQGANGRIWQDAAKALENKQAGMMFQGSNQVAANYAAANLPDLDFFVYPVINPTYGTDYMDAPTDGFCLSRKAKNPAAARKILEFLGTGPAESIFLESDKWDVGVASKVDPSGYDTVQKKGLAAIGACKAVSQFMDRDTDPGFASNVMIPAVQHFIDNHGQSDIAGLQKSIEAQAKSIFAG